MLKQGNERHQDYWEKNIKGYSGFYDATSEEDIGNPSLLVTLYKKFVFPLEKKVTRERYNLTCDYIEKNVFPGMTVADIGCGSGIFTKILTGRQAKVFAMDYSQSALDLTRACLTEPEAKSVDIMKLDILSEPIPPADVAIAIGVLPYIGNTGNFFGNILPFTQKFFFLFLDGDNFFNVVRRVLPILDVRHYYYQRTKDIYAILERHHFKVNKKIKLSTGFLIDVERC